MGSELLTPALATILGIIAPIIVSLIKNWRMPPGIVQLVVVAVSVIFGFLALLVSDIWTGEISWTIESFAGYATYIAAVAHFVYNTFFRGTLFNARLEDFGAPPTPLLKGFGGSSGPAGGSRPGPGL